MVERKSRKRINLALQGGGAHGAFTWGVLDRLLEDGRLDIAGVCGTSAGAMNGVALGLRSRTRRPGGGARDARPLLGPCSPSAPATARCSRRRSTGVISVGDMDFSPGWLIYDALSRMVSPYVANPGQHQSAGRGAGRGGRFRLAARAPHRSAVRLRHQRQDRQDPRVRLQRDLGQGDHGLGLPARPSIRRWRSTARATGTAASWATRRCSR